MDPKTAAILVALATIAVGLLSCFWGYRLFKIMLALWGFAIGAMAGVAFQSAAGHSGGGSQFLGLLVGGVIGAVLLTLLYYLGVFVVGAAAGALLVFQFPSVQHMADPRVPLLVGAVVVGLLALVLQKYVIIVITAFSGAWAVVNGAANLFGAQAFDWQAILPHRLSVEEISLTVQRLLSVFQTAARGRTVLVVAWVLLGVVGVVVQITRKK